jgi:calcineurin-like phosphoesterase family protein
MEDIYLIEIRLGTTKWRVKETIFAIAGHFRILKFIERHPHVTLYGPFSLNDGTRPDQLLETIGRIASGFGPVPFLIEGWEKRSGMHGGVIAYSVKPSESLHQLTASIAAALIPVTESYNHWDAFPDKKWFHVTIANRLDSKEAETIFDRITSSAVLPRVQRSRKGVVPAFMSWIRRHLFKRRLILWPLMIDETGLRITVMHGEMILAEYDLLQKTWVFGGESHSSRSWQNTLMLYRRQCGFELTAPRECIPGDIFVISDLHLGHANIIRYCSRPFLYSDTDEMDRVLADNWNYAVSEQCSAYFLGDFSYGTHTTDARAYRQKLRGNITFVKGNHDDGELFAVPSSTVEFNGFLFLLVHDPEDAPPDFDGWVIHGHHHNNDLRHYPFINFRERRINVSAEVTGYVPVGLHEISAVIRSHQARGNTDPVILRYSTP